MPITTVFQSLANAAGASASAAASDAPATTDFSNFEPIIPLPPVASFRLPRWQTSPESRPPAETRMESYRRRGRLGMRSGAQNLGHRATLASALLPMRAAKGRMGQAAALIDAPVFSMTSPI